MELTVPDTTTHRFVGLSNGNSNSDYTDVDFAIHPVIGGTIFIYEGGVSRGTFGSYTAGDKLRVAVEGGVVKYRKNGALLYTSTITPTYPLLVDSALHGTGDTLSNVVMNSGASGDAKVQWLVPDHLGTPRIILDQTGAFANVKRHDYLPFGEELAAGTGGRTAAMGYVVGDGIRQQFTQKERDIETELDYFGARYYSSVQGRFTSTDAPFIDQSESDPQSWNLYSYVRNNPLRLIDPTGRSAEDKCDSICQESKKKAEEARKQAEAEGIDTVVINTNQANNPFRPGSILATETKELEQIEERRQKGDERILGMVLGGDQRIRSMANYQISPILYLNPMPRYVQGEIDWPSPTGTTGYATQFTLDDQGTFWFSNGPYVGTPGGSLTLGWLSPRTNPEDFLNEWGGSVSMTHSKFVGGGLGYASGLFSPQICVGTPGVTGSFTYGTKVTNTRFAWRPKF